VIQPNNTYEYSGEMHMMEYTVSPSKTFSSEFVNPPKAVADYSGRAGKALVYTSEETYLLDIRNMLEPEVAGNTHIGMWMPDLGDIVRMHRIDRAPDDLCVAFLELRELLLERPDLCGAHEREIKRPEEQYDPLAVIIA
jgi:hypothetical protein